MYNQNDMLATQLERKIKEKLDAAGLVYRIFSRAKALSSIEEKKKRKSYNQSNKMTDVVGVRVVFYFNDDIELGAEIVGSLFSEVERVVDQPDKNSFSALRTNYVYRIPRDVSDMLIADRTFIDETFEVQLRSILQEGWQEVEHDLRYKCLEDWVGHDDKSRRLNSISATLENCEHSMKSIFDALAYSFYKEGMWERMLHHKFRLRFQSLHLEDSLCHILTENKVDAKAVYACDRADVVKEMLKFKMRLPITYASVLFVANRLTARNAAIKEMEPEVFKRNIPSK